MDNSCLREISCHEHFIKSFEEPEFSIDDYKYYNFENEETKNLFTKFCESHNIKCEIVNNGPLKLSSFDSLYLNIISHNIIPDPTNDNTVHLITLELMKKIINDNNTYVSTPLVLTT
jgi:hypothetical protein